MLCREIRYKAGETFCQTSSPFPQRKLLSKPLCVRCAATGNRTFLWTLFIGFMWSRVLTVIRHTLFCVFVLWQHQVARAYHPKMQIHATMSGCESTADGWNWNIHTWMPYIKIMNGQTSKIKSVATVLQKHYSILSNWNYLFWCIKAQRNCCVLLFVSDPL